MKAIYDKKTLKDGWAVVIEIGDDTAMRVFENEENFLQITEPPELLNGEHVLIECNIETGETRYRVVEIPIESPKTNPIDLIGGAVIQNSLDIGDIKIALDSIGQGIVEIMLNQNLGGI